MIKMFTTAPRALDFDFTTDLGRVGVAKYGERHVVRAVTVADRINASVQNQRYLRHGHRGLRDRDLDTVAWDRDAAQNQLAYGRAISGTSRDEGGSR